MRSSGQIIGIVLENENMMFGIVSEKKEDVMKLVQAMITGGVDLSPEEMVDAAFLMVERINDRLYGKK